MKKSFKVADGLFLVSESVSTTTAKAKPVEQPTNHLLVIDCSGSMSGDLPQIRTQLKRKLPKLLKDTDTVSIVWFSGRGQSGVLLEAEPVATLVDLKMVETAIDRWLRPIGLTGFKEPLEEVGRLVARVGKARPGSVFSLFFMSDGCDNQWSRPEILKTIEVASGGLASSTFVEYGYYADRALLTAMAEKAGGQLIFADKFDTYEPVFEAAMQRRPVGGKRIEASVQGDAVGGFVWTQEDGSLTTYGLEGGKVGVPEETKEIWYLSPTLVGERKLDMLETVGFRAPNGLPQDKSRAHDMFDEAVSAAYAAVSLFSVRMKPDVVLPLLGVLGDVAMLEDFGGLFGKQAYSAFMDRAKACAFDSSKRFTKGWNPKALPKDDAFTVLDMLKLLASDDENKVLFEHKDFRYSRISRGRINADLVLSDAERGEIDKLTEEMKKTKNAAKVKELSAKIDAITAQKKPLVFETTPQPEGYSVMNLTYNQENPNVSILLRKEGTVDVTSRVPETLRSALPAKVPTFIWRNYAIVKDGLVNVEVLPCVLSKPTIAALLKEAAAGRLPDEVLHVENDLMLLNFKSLPIINRKMAKATSAKTFFENEWVLTKLKAEQKVFNTLLRAFGKKSQSYEELYGKEAADWLVSQGFGDNGFAPKEQQADVRDFYMAKELAVSIKSFSSIPSLNEFQKQSAKGKLTPSAAIMEPAVNAAKGHETDEAWLRTEQKKLDKQRRQRIVDKAQQVFCTIVGQVWFTEFSSLDENAMSLTLDGKKLDFRVEVAEVKIEI